MAVTDHLYQNHLSLNVYPFNCKLCHFIAYQRTKFTKHGKWYMEHQMRIGAYLEPLVSTYLQVRDNTALFGEKIIVLFVEESLQLWELRKR